MRSEDTDFVDLDAERAVLSAILQDDSQARGAYALAATHVRVKIERRDDGSVVVAGDFNDPRHNLIFAAMGEVAKRAEDIDAQSVGAELQLMGRWNAVGGSPYFSEVIAAAVTSAHIETHARIVRREADRRRVDLALARARRALRSSRDPDAALVSALEVVRRDAEAGSVRGGPRPLFDHCAVAWREIEERMGGRGPAPMTLGLSGLDRATGGAFPGQVVTIAGVQGRGKTAWLAQVLKANARRFIAEARETRETRSEAKRAAWWSLEMPGSELMYRHAGWDAGVSQGVLRGGALDQDQIDGVAASFNMMSSLPIDLDGESAPNVLDIRAWLFAHPNTRLAAVDWLGCLQPHPEAPRSAKAHEHAAINMQVLAMTARQLGITIIVPNQFTQDANRGTEQTMHDMLGGAAVVNFSSIILVMRPGDAMAGDNLPVSIRAEKSRLSGNVVIEAVFRRATGDFIERDSAPNVARLPVAKAGRGDPRRQTAQWQYGDDAPTDDARTGTDDAQ